MQSLSPSGPAHLGTRADHGQAVHSEQRSEGELSQGGSWLVTECRGYESPVRKPGHSWHAPGLAPRKPQRVPGHREDSGADELPGIGGWFFACSGRGTETLAGCVLLLARFPGPSHPRVSALPNEDVLAVISASFLDSSGHH